MIIFSNAHHYYTKDLADNAQTINEVNCRILKEIRKILPFPITRKRGRELENRLKKGKKQHHIQELSSLIDKLKVLWMNNHQYSRKGRKATYIQKVLSVVRKRKTILKMFRDVIVATPFTCRPFTALQMVLNLRCF